MPAYGMICKMVVEELYLEMLNAMDMIDTNISDGDLLGFFCLEAEGKNKIMKKAWALFESCIVKENDMSKFEAFYQANINLFPEDAAARMISIGKRIGYLYH